MNTLTENRASGIDDGKKKKSLVWMEMKSYRNEWDTEKTQNTTIEIASGENPSHGTKQVIKTII